MQIKSPSSSHAAPVPPLRTPAGMSASEDGKSAQQQLDTAKDQLKWLDNLMGSNDYVCGDRCVKSLQHHKLLGFGPMGGLFGEVAGGL